MKAFCGIDWAEDHHDVAVVDQAGQLLAKRRINDSAEGFDELLKLLADVGDDPDDPIPVAIETPRGLLVAALRSTGRKVFAINPMAVARYRERHSVARKKSDHVDAMTLAGILRTDAHAHRPLPDDTDLARAIAVLARAHQDAIWRRTRASNTLRSLLREYFPAFLTAFAGDRSTNLASRDARAVLAIAFTPTAAARLSRKRIAAALRRAGRQRGVDELARRIQQVLRQPQLHQPPLVEEAWESRPARCWPSWTPSAPTSTGSAKRSPRASPSTPTMRSSPASPVWATSSERGCRPRSATTGPGSPTPEG